jgi:hypothetical protein
MQKAYGIKKAFTVTVTWCNMGIVKQVQQLDKNTEMRPVTSIKASYYIEEEICMLTLMVDRVEDEFLTIIQ